VLGSATSIHQNWSAEKERANNEIRLVKPRAYSQTSYGWGALAGDRKKSGYHWR